MAWRLQRLRRSNRRRALGMTETPVLFVIDADCVGLFAHVTWFVLLTQWAQAANRQVAFACVSINYRDKTGPANWLPEVLVQPRCAVPRTEEDLARTPSIRVADLKEFPLPRSQLRSLSIPAARECFGRSFAVSAPVKTEVDRLLQLWGNFFLIGVHYRGTDKKREAPPVEYAVVLARLRQVDAALKRQGIERTRFFVATDDADFLHRLRQDLPESVVACEGVTRSTDGNVIHFGKNRNTGSHNAVDAMIDALVLARCPILVRTASFLSGWSAVLAEQPQLVFTFNSPFPKKLSFPDSELIKTTLGFENLEAKIAGFVKPLINSSR